MRSAVPTVDLEPVFEPTPEAARRLQRLRRLAWILDRSIPLGGGYRIGLDPIIGLIPGLGDWLGAALSLFLVHEAVRLGVPAPVVARMLLNILIEASVGTVPMLCDIFDAAWQANQRNLRLVERHYDPRRRPQSLRRMALLFAGFAVLFLIALGALVLFSANVLWSLLTGG